MGGQGLARRGLLRQRSLPARQREIVQVTIQPNLRTRAMASYVESSLLPGEKVLYKGRLSVKAYWFTITMGFFGALIIGIAALSEGSGKAIFFFLLFLWLMAYPYVARAVTELAITNKRVISKFGLISRKTVELRLDKIESLQVNQGVFGRMLNYGSIVLAGAGNPQAPIPSVDNPLAFRKAFLSISDEMTSADQRA